MTYKCTDTPTRAVVIHNPELRMDLESLEEGVDVLGLCILQLLEHLDFVEDFLYAVVPYGTIFFIILGVHIDDLNRHHTVMQEIVAKFCPSAQLQVPTRPKHDSLWELLTP